MKARTCSKRAVCCSTSEVVSRRSAAVKYLMQVVCLFLLAAVATLAEAQAGTLIAFVPPAGGYAASANGTFTATLKLLGTAPRARCR